MTANYKILRPVTPADLDVNPRFVKVLKMIPPDGYVTRDHFRHLETNRVDSCLTYAFSSGILKRILPWDNTSKLESVKFWCTQLNKPNHSHTSPNGTRQLYLSALAKLDNWLPGKQFQSHKTVMRDGQIIKQPVTKSFANVEEMLHYCIESDYGTKTAQRAVREYLTSPQACEMSNSVHSNTRAAIKSYFGINDVVLVLPKSRKKLANHAYDDDPMTLEDFYKMLQKGKPGIMMHTIMLIKLQSGMDSSTFADRFNYEGYSQIVKYFRTDDHRSWNIEMCPVPIQLVRVKTNIRHTTFLDRDAITQLQEYLTWKETKHGKQDPSKPLFVTQRNMPIYSIWLSTHFSAIGKRAGIQKKVSPQVYKIRAHEVRDLLKSTLITCGCAQYAADHVLGHAPRDSYEKQAVLYPKDLRAEYAKASSRLNIISKVEGNLNTAEDPASLLARIKELEGGARASKQSKTEMNMTKETDNDIIKKMHTEIRRLASMLNSLPDDIKKQMEDRFEDSDGSEDSDKSEDSDGTN